MRVEGLIATVGVVVVAYLRDVYSTPNREVDKVATVFRPRYTLVLESRISEPLVKLAVDSGYLLFGVL